MVDLDNGEWVFIEEIPFTDGAHFGQRLGFYGEDHPFNMESSIVTVEVRDLCGGGGGLRIKLERLGAVQRYREGRR